MAHPLDRDEDLRSSCFASLDVLQARYGPELHRSVLAEGFNFRGRRVPFFNPGYGIYRAAAQRGDAALSINSAYKQIAYQDERTDDGVLYKYWSGAIDERFNVWLRQAHSLRVPIVYFIGTRANHYRPEYPAFIEEDRPSERRVLVTFGRARGPYDEREWAHIDDPDERRYVFREVRQRVHQAQFRGAVLPAYKERCAICSLKEARLLDAAHIIGDSEEHGQPVVRNGLSLCTIHHRAFDQDLVGISPDNRVHVSRRLLDEEDGPMLELLKGFHGRDILLPERRIDRPDQERLAVRFEQFRISST